MKALRHIKTGELYPMHEHLSKHPDIEFVDLDARGNVIEPEEAGPAAEAPTPRKRTRRKAETADTDTTEDDLSIGDE